ncbi:MAG: TetR family transcriptional regulator [Deltaproteobacteria bacterium]|nr:TetR family transcriptional regulator [Deltaproteobacteria bacterium]
MDTRPNAKTRLLRVAARIVHQKGFQNAGLQEILAQAEIPKGSFYFYFKSKEDFGLQLIDFYANFYLGKAQQILDGIEGPFVPKLRQFLDWQGNYMEANGCEGGCPFGILSQEMADRNEKFRKKLEEVFEQLREKTAHVLILAQEAGEINPILDPVETADFIISAWQGTLIQMKVAKSGASRKAFLAMVFDRILEPL